MTRRLACLLLLAALGAGCPSEQEAKPSLPDKPGKRQVDLAGKIFNAIPDAEKLGPDAENDAGLALAQIVVPGYAARLRLHVAEDHPGVARGAAVALVAIRVLGQADRAKVLAECAESETIEAMRQECAHPGGALFPNDKPFSGSVESGLEAGDPETRRAAIRELLRSRQALSDVVLAKLIHRLDDSDLRVKLLAWGLLLRDSLEKNPLPPEPQ